MSQPIHPNSSSQPPGQNPPAEVPEFLVTANKGLKICIAILVGLAGLGAVAIGITFTPFSREAGAAAFAVSAAAFSLSGCIFYSAFSRGDTPNLADRAVTAH